MAHVGRLAGAILIETQGRYFIVGDSKVPVDYAAEGFMPIAERNVLALPYVALEALRPIKMGSPLFKTDLEGEPLAQKIVDCFLIFRNGSVSDRLWRLVMKQSRELSDGVFDVNWLTMMPNGIWEMVRDQVLRC